MDQPNKADLVPVKLIGTMNDAIEWLKQCDYEEVKACHMAEQLIGYWVDVSDLYDQLQPGNYLYYLKNGTHHVSATLTNHRIYPHYKIDLWYDTKGQFWTHIDNVT